MPNNSEYPQSLQDLDAFYGTEDPWSYDTSPDDHRRIEALRESLPRIPFQRTLDIGCGNGFVTVHLPGRHVVGVDLSPRAIEWARARAKRIGKQIDYRIASVFDIDRVVDAHSFDLVVVTGVLYEQYIGKSHDLIALKIDRILREGGYVALVHIAEWYRAGLPYRLIDRQIYQYREYSHIIEVYKK